MAESKKAGNSQVVNPPRSPRSFLSLSPSMGFPSIDFPQTQRVVFLIDLQPLSHLPVPDLYVSAILKCAGRFLSHPPLSDSLFAFRLFFSSLNPLLPTSQVERLLGSSFSPTISFERPSDVSRSLESVLRSVASGTSSPSRAAFVAGSLQQLLLDYAWETALPDLQGTDDAADSCFGFPPNLVLLFTVAPRTREFLYGYLDIEIDSRNESEDWLSNKFIEAFGGVCDKFKAVGANVCWVDVGFPSQGQNKERDGKVLGVVERGIKGSGWGFVSCDAIVLGSLIVPFRLIWPIVACLTGFSGRRCGTAEFNLQIADANGKPLNCRLCDLEIVNLKFPTDHLDHSLSKRSPERELKSCNLQDFWKRFGNTGVKIHVDEVRSRDQLAVTRARTGKFVFLRGFYGKREDVSKRKRSKEESSSIRSIADVVLERLRWKDNEFIAGRPEWQLLLTFLYKRFSVAIVSFSDENGCSITGILEPFTVHTAILQILDDGQILDGCSQESLGGISISSQKTGGVSGDSFSNKGSVDFRERAERKNAYSSSLTDLTWDALYTSILCNSSETESSVVPAMDLQSLCLHGGCSMSKRLTFLKCWMKQNKKSKGHHKVELSRGELKVDLEDRTEDMLLSSQQSSQSVTNFVQEDQHFSSCQSVGENLIDKHIIKHETPAFCLEDSDAFFSSIWQKIDHGLCNMDVDLASLAERLVDLSIKHVRAKHDGSGAHENSTSSNCDSQTSQTACGISVLIDVAKLLLKRPKELAAKYKRLRAPTMTEPSNSNLTSDLIPEASIPEIKVREHQLQMLFRMEILKMTVEVGSKDEIDDKWVKEICFLLHNIEFDLQGGIFGGVTLLEFTDNTIKSRYANILGGVIHTIYIEMEFLSFDSVPSGSNDSDSNQAANDIIGPRDQISGAAYTDENRVTMDSSGCISRSLHRLEEEYSIGEKHQNDLYDKQLKKALKNREQAQKCSFFNKRLPDLRRVWAPKHLGKVNTRPITKHDRKKHTRETADVVYETPALATKRSRRLHESRFGEHEETSSFRSVSKVLFPSFESIEISSESGCKT